MNESLGDRMKRYYEDRGRVYLTRRTPAILRIDGRAFHTLTRKLTKPFDSKLSACMDYAASGLVKEIQGAKLAYVQSDEISILLTDTDRLDTQAWFDYNVQKMCSVAAATATAEFNMLFGHLMGIPTRATFDCRCFNIPQNEVANYFLWRAKDWHRNSVQMYARANFSHKELHGKSQAEIHDMLYQIEKNWCLDVGVRFRNGMFLNGKGEPSHENPNYTEIGMLVKKSMPPSDETGE